MALIDFVHKPSFLIRIATISWVQALSLSSSTQAVAESSSKHSRYNWRFKFQFPHSPAQLCPLIKNDTFKVVFIYFFIEVHKIRRTTLLFTIIFEACYLLKLGLNVEAEIQILNWKTDDKPRKWRDNSKFKYYRPAIIIRECQKIATLIT